MKFEPANGVTDDYLNEFVGHEFLIIAYGIEGGLDSIRRNPIKTYMETVKGKSTYGVTEENKDIVARLDEIAGMINLCAVNGSLTKEMFYELYEEARRLVYGE